MFSSAMLLAALLPCQASPASAIVRVNPATDVAGQLCMQRAELREKEQLYQEEHPALKQLQRRVDALEQTLKELIEQGYLIDQQHVAALLEQRVMQTKVAFAVARQEFTDVHPQRTLLRLRLYCLAQITGHEADQGEEKAEQ